jgi:hypothetical protein
MARHILTATLAIAALALSNTVKAQRLKYADFRFGDFREGGRAVRQAWRQEVRSLYHDEREYDGGMA